MNPIIDISNIEFQYSGAEKPTLNIQQFQIQKGEKIFLFGPSGGGKSTLLEILAGILVPQKGQVSILGQNLNQLSSVERDQFRAGHLGYIFQSFNLIPYLNVRENIELPLHLSPLRRSRLGDNLTQKKEFHHIVTALGIDHLIEKKVTELSVGQAQRVAVARALYGKPELILADEPTSSLDHDHREKFIHLLFRICEESKTTVLFVSHDRSLEKMFDRSVKLSEINQVGQS
ncbi:MAG: methionine ABC transporter ATP-binding protein [Oligoflexia bacterium]|nr:MAG: methionine ABC transporter ATP-binding protein [Oligoflexia bacterium]